MNGGWPRIAGSVGLVVGGLAAGYPWLLRRQCLTWGATAQETAREYPGDDLLSAADIVSTRAVTIAAPPAAIWPWLVQMGSGRGGAYSYDWIENLLGLSMHSASAVLPQFQDVKVGDEFRLGPGRSSLRVEVLDPQRALTLLFEDRRWVWTFALFPGGAMTRLVSRNRITMPPASPLARFVSQLIMEPGGLVMERKMLRGIKQRAEGLARQQSRLALVPAG
jgi:hypothetical protein